jgi:hypothetical protein
MLCTYQEYQKQLNDCSRVAAMHNLDSTYAYPPV